MGLVSNSGSLSSKSSAIISTSNIKDDACIGVQTDITKRVSENTYVKNTLNNQNAINYDYNQETIKMLLTELDGGSMIVQYFHQELPPTDEYAGPIDVSQVLHDVHKAYLQINDFELLIQDSFQFDYNTDEDKARISGTAICFPYFNPKVGDLFLYEIEPRKIGLFKVSSKPTRLSIRTLSAHSFNFELISYPNKAELDKLDKSVREVAWFNKTRFLVNHGALLTADENILLKDIDKLSNLLKIHYMDAYFDSDIYCSLCRPDGIYDPYVVEFMNKIVSPGDFPRYPVQLVPSPKYYNNSIWAKLLNPDMVPWELYFGYYTTEKQRYTYRSANINALINKDYILLTKSESSVVCTLGCGIGYRPLRVRDIKQCRVDLPPNCVNPDELFPPFNKVPGRELVWAGHDPCPTIGETKTVICDCPCCDYPPPACGSSVSYISDWLNHLDTIPQSDFDKLLYTYFTNRCVNIYLLLQLAKEFVSLSDMEQFYKVPIYMFLLSAVKNSIVTARGDIKYNTPVFLPTQYRFTKSDLEENSNKLVIKNTGNKVIAVVDDNGNQCFFKTKDILYSDKTITINLSNVMNELQVTEISNSWSLIMSGEIVEYSDVCITDESISDSDITLEEIDDKEYPEINI